MPPAGAPRSNPTARQEPYAYGYPADPYYVVLPPAPQLHVRRRRRLRLVAYAAALVICLGLLLGGAFYFFWPSQPEIQVSHTQFNDMNFQTIPNPGSDVPYLFMNTSMNMFLQIKNTDFFNVWYDSVNVGLGYRGQMIGVFESEGGRLAARQTVYLNSTLELYGTEVSNDVGNFLEDLARKELPLDTVAEFSGGIRLLYAKFSLKKAVSCEVVVNPDNQTVLSQDCGLVI